MRGREPDLRRRGSMPAFFCMCYFKTSASMGAIPGRRAHKETACDKKQVPGKGSKALGAAQSH